MADFGSKGRLPEVSAAALRIDLRSLGLVTNLTVYARTNLSNRASGELMVDPEGRFVLVSYGCD